MYSLTNLPLGRSMREEVPTGRTGKEENCIRLVEMNDYHVQSSARCDYSVRYKLCLVLFDPKNQN